MENSAHIQIGGPVGDVRELVGRLFWKQPDMAEIALGFLDYVKEWGRSETPFVVSQWQNYCERKGITQSQYHNMLKRLRRAGMIEKRYNKVKAVHELFLSDVFSESADSMCRVWDEYGRR